MCVCYSDDMRANGGGGARVNRTVILAMCVLVVVCASKSGDSDTSRSTTQLTQPSASLTHLHQPNRLPHSLTSINDTPRDAGVLRGLLPAILPCTRVGIEEQVLDGVSLPHRLLPEGHARCPVHV